MKMSIFGMYSNGGAYNKLNRSQTLTIVHKRLQTIIIAFKQIQTAINSPNTLRI